MFRYLAQFTAVILIVLTSGCASYNVGKFVDEKPITKQLPNMQIDVDRSNFDQLYPASCKVRSSHILGKGVTQKEMWALEAGIQKTMTEWEEGTGTVKYVVTRPLNRHGDDAASIIKKTVQESWLGSTSQRPAGKLKWRVTSRQAGSNRLMMVPSILTAFTINLLGAPLYSMSAKVGLELIVEDDAGKQIASYAAEGKGGASVAMYWGYSTKNLFTASDRQKVSLAAHAKAVKDGIKKIREQMQADQDRLFSSLGGADR